MAVTIPSDLVADVMQAADPALLRAATARLSSPAGLADERPPAFAEVLAAQGSTPAPANTEGQMARPLEQFVWQALFGTMLPAGEPGLFGSGPGSGIWRSMVVEQLAAVVTESPGSELIPAAADIRRDGIAARDGWPYFASPPIRSYVG